MEECQDTISKLKFISKVSKGDKINSKELMLQSDGLVTKISRSVYHVDNRQNALSFIQNTINSGFKYLSSYAGSEKLSEQHLAKNLLIDIIGAKNGINNLRTTYCDDTMFCCTLDTYFQSIEVRMMEIQEQYPKLFENMTKEDNKNNIIPHSQFVSKSIGIDSESKLKPDPPPRKKNA